MGMELKILRATREVNEAQKQRIPDKIEEYCGPNLKGKTFALWGVAFKANTDDVRESAALHVAAALLKAQATVHFYDPVAGSNFKRAMEEEGHSDTERLVSFQDKYKALTGAQALVVLTEWREFSEVDFSLVKKHLANSLVIDGRNIFDGEKVRALGLDYVGLGRPHIRGPVRP